MLLSLERTQDCRVVDQNTSFKAEIAEIACLYQLSCNTNIGQVKIWVSKHECISLPLPITCHR